MTVAVMGYDADMGRWQPNARGRLEQAALELFGERGYESTTVADIAMRAGLTERTFFRHFADKREVLFWGGGLLQDYLVGRVDAAPAGVPPLQAIVAALSDAGPAIFEARRELARRRAAIIAANAELQERERNKLASLASALAGALRRRGVQEPSASLAAELGMTIFHLAFARWIGDGDGRSLAAILGACADELRAVARG